MKNNNISLGKIVINCYENREVRKIKNDAKRIKRRMRCVK